jgi:L-amino acid N-acyltransferase YncA
MVGYLAVKKYEVEEKTGYEASIIIDSKFRTNGLAKKMTNKVFNNISKDKVVEAWVHQNNVPSLQTVKSLGFKFKKHFKEDRMIRIFTKRGQK